jgi:hypothetical protein
VEWRLSMCVSPAWQAWQAWPREMEIVQACPGLKAWPGRDRECLWIPSFAGLKGSSSGGPADLRGGSLG